MDSTSIDSTTIATFQPVAHTANDTCAVNVTGTTVVSVAEMPQDDSQPSGWVQLLLPLGIALFVVFLEKWLSLYYDHRQQRKARKRYRETVLDWIGNIMPFERNFNQTISELSKNISSSEDMLPLPYAMPLALHDKLTGMSVEQMADAFLRDFKNKKDERYVQMFNILSGFEFLSKTTESVTKSYDLYNKQMFDLCRDWNATYESFIDKYNSMPEPNQYQTVVEAWQKELVNTPSSRTVHIRYLEKLLVLAAKSKDFSTLSLINRMRRTVQQSQGTSNGFADNFGAMSHNLDVTIDSLVNAVQYFRDNEPDDCCFFIKMFGLCPAKESNTVHVGIVSEQ